MRASQAAKAKNRQKDSPKLVRFGVAWHPVRMGADSSLFETDRDATANIAVVLIVLATAVS